MINVSTKENPEFSQKYCDRCGTETITKFPTCHHEIQGKYHVEGVFSIGTTPAPAFCLNCGHPFPWTQIRIETAKELAQEMDNLTAEDKTTLSNSIEEIIKDSPKTTLAATKFKNIMLKTSKAAAEGIKDILVDIASETAKKVIWPG